MSKPDCKVKNVLKVLLDEHDFEFSEDPETEEEEISSMFDRCVDKIKSLINGKK